MRKLSAWSAQVHDYCLSNNKSITTAEAATMFGPPPGGTVSNMLNSATSAGYFRRETFQEEGERQVVTRVRYIPVDKPLSKNHRSSWFDGMQRVRSVFELGQDGGFLQ